jgi:hypothetical protein
MQDGATEMTTQLHTLLERIMILCMLVGIAGMFQPWIPSLFGYGFLLLLFGTIGFTVISNITPRYAGIYK